MRKKTREEEEEDAHKTQRTGASRGSSGFVEMRLLFRAFFSSFFLVAWAANKAKFNWQLEKKSQTAAFFLFKRGI